MLSDIITEISSGLASKKLSEMKESDPEKYDETLKLFINAAELGINFMQESPEFRAVFARIHSEFLNYPESKATIHKAIEEGRKELENLNIT